jgi:dolichol-phosphate mannosyltransferase
VKKLSIIIPVYFNEGSIPSLEKSLAELEAKLLAKDTSLELIFVNDGSRDSSLEMLKEIQSLRPKTIVLNHLANRGSMAAIKTGLKRVTGECFTYLAADLQDPPELIEQFLEHWILGYKVVSGVRIDRKESRAKKVFRNIG